MSKTRLTKEEELELSFNIDVMDNGWNFEHYCNSCENFGTDECPFKEKAGEFTNWKSLKCDKYLN